MKKKLGLACRFLAVFWICSGFTAARADELPDTEEAGLQEEPAAGSLQDAAAGATSVSAAALPPFSLGAAVDERYDRGIACMYRLEFDKAELEFRGIIELDTASPAGYFALAALSWWRYSQNFDVKADFKGLEDEFMRNAENTIKVSKEGLKRGLAPDHAYFFMGSAYGIQGRWHAVQKRWFRAYIRGNKGRKLLRKSVKLNPGLYDAYLGLGIFDYFADALPGILKIPALLFVRGDRARGLSEVRLALEKGRFFSLEARLFLIEILTRHEKNLEGALDEVQKLKATDPSNMFFRLGEILTLVHGEAWQKVIEECGRFLQDYKRLSPPGLAQQLSLIYLSAGDAWLALNGPEEAAGWFTDGITLTAFPNKGWITYCHLRRGHALDLLGKREDAVRDYRTVMQRDNFWDSQKYGKRALKKAPDFKEIYRQLMETD
ncbi:MAG: hypothetical protein HY796_09790 [Elusimicrobia bacterium]|nr:hypothetical protein [Elusimicrobiota bacterium]